MNQVDEIDAFGAPELASVGDDEAQVGVEEPVASVFGCPDLALETDPLLLRDPLLGFEAGGSVPTGLDRLGEHDFVLSGQQVMARDIIQVVRDVVYCAADLSLCCNHCPSYGRNRPLYVVVNGFTNCTGLERSMDVKCSTFKEISRP